MILNINTESDVDSEKTMLLCVLCYQLLKKRYSKVLNINYY